MCTNITDYCPWLIPKHCGECAFRPCRRVSKPSFSFLFAFVEWCSARCTFQGWFLFARNVFVRYRRFFDVWCVFGFCAFLKQVTFENGDLCWILKLTFPRGYKYCNEIYSISPTLFPCLWKFFCNVNCPLHKYKRKNELKEHPFNSFSLLLSLE